MNSTIRNMERDIAEAKARLEELRERQQHEQNRQDYEARQEKIRYQCDIISHLENELYQYRKCLD